MAISHVYQVPFPEAGHAINMLNVATILASPSTQVHVLVLSQKNTAKWLKATGQAANPNVHIQTISNGTWEEWEAPDARGLVSHVQSPEFTRAVGEAIEQNKQQFPNDNHSAIVFNGLMFRLTEVAQAHAFKALLLGPTPYYMGTVGNKQQPDGSTKPTDPLVLKGIGGSDTDLHMVYGDAIDLIGPMYHKMFKPTAEKCDGVIWSNTNEGLEGSEYRQSHLPTHAKVLNDYFIGPILPPLYYRALDAPEALKQQLATADSSSPCIAFLNKHPAKSVVYVALGSYAALELDQAVTLVKALRNHKQPWVLVHRTETDALEAAVGEHPDGIITPWAPQIEVLLHPATKCVLSHGGFGTMIEGVFAGQPFITSPVMSDQFMDAKVMLHLGICVGTIAENRFESILERKKVVPRWPDDGGKQIDEVFERAFGSGGEAVLAKARDASLALRARMVRVKETQGVNELQRLRTDLAEPKSAI